MPSPEASLSRGLNAPDIDSLPLADVEEDSLQLDQLVSPIRFDLMPRLEEIDLEDFGEEAEARKRRNGGKTTKGKVEVEDERRRGRIHVIAESMQSGLKLHEIDAFKFQCTIRCMKSKHTIHRQIPLSHELRSK